MDTKIVLSVRGVDLDDPMTLDTLGKHLDDLGWESVGGQVTAVLYTDSPDPIAAALDVVSVIEKVLPGAAVFRVDEQLMSVGDIADHVGVSTEGVRLWTVGKRRAAVGFPVPRAQVSQGRTLMKIWAWADVLAWLRTELHLDPEEGVRYLSDRQVADLNVELASRVPGAQRWHPVIDHGCTRVLSRVDDLLDATAVPTSAGRGAAEARFGLRVPS
jgi:hypothetical protein